MCLPALALTGGGDRAPVAAYARAVSELPGEVLSSIHNHLQKARSDAAAIEDRSTRPAVESLDATTTEPVNAVRRQAD